ncbi:MAG: GGDEF domain-containing protein [Eubacteriales bacterium]
MRRKRTLIATEIVLLLASAVFTIFHLYTLVFRDKVAAEDLFPVAAAILFALILTTYAVIVITDKLVGSQDEKVEDTVADKTMYKYLPEIFDAFDYIGFEYDCKTDVLKLSKSLRAQIDAPSIFENFLSSLESITEIHPSDVYRLREYASSSDYESGVQTIEIRLAINEGEYRWHLVRAIKVYLQKDSKIVGAINNIHEMKEERQRLIEKANTDSLTGLYTRDVIRQKVNDFIAFRGENEAGTLFYLDVDNFKEINDVLGHTMGDKVLVDIAQSLRIACTCNSVICRMGGDEFAIFLPECGSVENAKMIGDYIRSSLRRTYSNSVSSRILSISVGAALTCDSDTDFSQLYDRADKALSNAKAKGKNYFEIFDFVEDGKKYEAFPEWGIF